MEEIRTILAALYREDISTDEAEVRLGQLGTEAVSEFVVDAFGRGWISRCNLGLDEDGNLL